MTDPLAILTGRFRAATTAALGPVAKKDPLLDPAIRRSDRADFQANGVMNLAKALGQNPRDLAAAILAALRVDDVCAKVEIAGPGFINMWMRDDALTRLLVEAGEREEAFLERSASPEKVVIDYSSPNVAKEMHVGHLRSTIIGDSLARTLEARGHTVVRQNHLGDWGTPFGMLIEHLVDLGRDDAELLIDDLDAFYRAARAKFDADPDFAERSRRRVVLLQGGEAGTLVLWSKLVEQSRRYFGEAYERLGITLRDSDVAGESLYNEMLPDVIAELEKKRLVVESEGALCVFPPGFASKDGGPMPLIVRKQGGGYGYATTDLAGIRHRTQTLGAKRLLYVVGAPQSQHLAMVFATARLAGWLAPPVRAEHVAFGSVLGPDRKMFKTRSGETVKLVSLVEEAEQRALAVVAQKNPDLDAETQKAVAHAVGIGAIKYADLSSDRIKDYVFDWDRMLAFEGNTAPYAMYAHARIRSILRKAGVVPDVRVLSIASAAEHALALDLLAFPSIVADVEQTLEPHRLCGYVFSVATAFTTFYEKCPVLQADTPEQTRSRLALCELTARTLARALSLLGIEAPNRM